MAGVVCNTGGTTRSEQQPHACGSHHPHAGGPHPGLPGLLGLPLLVLPALFSSWNSSPSSLSAAAQPGCTHTRSCPPGAQGYHPGAMQLGSQASSAPWACKARAGRHGQGETGPGGPQLACAFAPFEVREPAHTRIPGAPEATQAHAATSARVHDRLLST